MPYAQLQSNAAPPLSGNPADQYASSNPYGVGPQQSAGVAHPTNVVAFQHPGSNPYYPTAGTGSGVIDSGDHSTDPPSTHIDPNLDYVAAFNASLARQRQSIDNQLAHSLGALGHRRDLAAAQIATMPGVIDKNFDQAAAATGVGAQVDKGAVSADATGGSANAQLLSGAFQADKAAGHAATPLMQLGAQANYDVGDAGLNQQAMLGREQIDSRSADFALQQGERAAQWQHEQQLQSSQYAHEDATRDEARRYNEAHPGATGGRDYVGEHQANALFDAQLKALQPNPADDKYARGFNFPSNQALQAVLGSGGYKWAKGTLEAGPKGQYSRNKKGGLDTHAVLSDHHVTSQTVDALRSQGLITDDDVDWYDKNVRK